MSGNKLSRSWKLQLNFFRFDSVKTQTSLSVYWLSNVRTHSSEIVWRWIANKIWISNCPLGFGCRYIDVRVFCWGRSDLYSCLGIEIGYVGNSDKIRHFPSAVFEMIFVLLKIWNICWKPLKGLSFWLVTGKQIHSWMSQNTF